MKWCRHSYCMSPSRQWVANAMEGAQVRVREGQFMLGPLFSAGPKKSAKLRWWKAVSPQYCRSQSLYVFCSYLQTCFLYLEKKLSVFNLNMRNSQYYLTRFYIEVTFINQISTQLAYFFFFFFLLRNVSKFIMNEHCHLCPAFYCKTARTAAVLYQYFFCYAAQ